MSRCFLVPRSGSSCNVSSVGHKIGDPNVLSTAPNITPYSCENMGSSSTQGDPGSITAAGSALPPSTPSVQDLILSAVNLLLSQFWIKIPSVRFIQVEAQFKLKHITSQMSRYLHVVSCLPTEIAEALSDVLARPPPSNQYDDHKAAILNRNADTKPYRLHQLLTTEELGDRCPSQMLRRTRQLFGDPSAVAETSLLCEMFFQRLPWSMVVVSAAADDITFDKLAVC